LLALLVTALELAGYPGKGRTLQALLFASAALVGLLGVAWAAGAARKVLLLYGSCLLTLVAAEAGLRLVPGLEIPTSGRYDFLFRFDDKLGWRFVPNSEEVVEFKGEYRTTVKINSEGFRDREPDKHNRAPGVAVFGDSFVTNFGVEDREVFTELVRGSWGSGLSVRNYGVNGYGQVQEMLLLDEILRSRRPALALVVLYTRNDFDDNVGAFDWIQGYKRPRCGLKSDGQIEIVCQLQEPEPPSRLVRAINETRTHRLLHQAYVSMFPEQQPVSERPPEIRYCRRDLEPREQKAMEITKALLREMKRRCDQHQCRFGVVIAPSLWQVQRPEWDRLLTNSRLDARDFDRTLPNRLLAEWCAEQEYPCLDLLPTLEAFAGTGESLYYPKEQHWNGLGNKRVADAIVAWLRPVNLGSQVAPLGSTQP
jgi:hypothetical protein